METQQALEHISSFLTTERSFKIPDDLMDTAIVAARELGLTPQEVLVAALRHGLTGFPELRTRPSRVSRMIARQRVFRREPLPHLSPGSPAASQGLVSGKKPCYSCRRLRPFSGGYHCPTCRGRAGQFGWCGCGAALYNNGCYPFTKATTGVHARARREAKTKANLADC